MKRSKIILIVFIFCSFLLFFTNEISNSKANPLTVYPSEFGGFIPKDDHSCSMPKASVLFEIYDPKPYSPFNLEFTGNYTLYNPNNTLNLTIAAPFSSLVFGQNSTCTIKINGSIIPYELIEYQWNETYSWDNYISVYERNLIVCNITIPMNKTIILEYSFKTYVKQPRLKIDYLRFDYDIGTAAAWNGTISETVEFKVHGRQPDSYSDYYNFSIIDISDGKRYIWEWKNIVIPTGMWPVFISYRIVDSNYISFGNYYLVFLLLGIISVIILQRRVKSIKILISNSNSIKF